MTMFWFIEKLSFCPSFSFLAQMMSWISINVMFQWQSLKLCRKRRKFQAGHWECFCLICYKSGSSCTWKCNASSVIIMPVAGLIRTADSQAMQQELDILNGPDIIVLTFYFLYPFWKRKWWMRFLDGLGLFKFGVLLYHRPISTSFNARLSFGNLVEVEEHSWAVFL